MVGNDNVVCGVIACGEQAQPNEHINESTMKSFYWQEGMIKNGVPSIPLAI